MSVATGLDVAPNAILAEVREVEQASECAGCDLGAAPPRCCDGRQRDGAAPAFGEEVPPVLQKLQKWANYPSFGTVVRPSRFLPGKTPLAGEIIQNWSLAEPPKHPHTLRTFLAAVKARGERIGAIIDLSNHECLYAADVPEDLEYNHIELVAKVFPSLSAIRAVIRAANEFWARKPDQEIAIHCAYGFNRTGFVVCSYLVLAAGLSVPDALAAFAAARPPGIRHQSFVAELYRRHGGAYVPPRVLSARPPTTGACNGDSAGGDGGGGDSGGDDSGGDDSDDGDAHSCEAAAAVECPADAAAMVGCCASGADAGGGAATCTSSGCCGRAERQGEGCSGRVEGRSGDTCDSDELSTPLRWQASLARALSADFSTDSPPSGPPQQQQCARPCERTVKVDGVPVNGVTGLADVDCSGGAALLEEGVRRLRMTSPSVAGDARAEGR